MKKENSLHSLCWFRVHILAMWHPVNVSAIVVWYVSATPWPVHWCTTCVVNLWKVASLTFWNIKVLYNMGHNYDLKTLASSFTSIVWNVSLTSTIISKKVAYVCVCVCVCMCVCASACIHLYVSVGMCVCMQMLVIHVVVDVHLCLCVQVKHVWVCPVCLS